MYARIATFEGAPGNLEEGIAAGRELVEASLDSPREGLEGVRDVWMFVDRETGRGLGITLFDSEDDLRRGDDALDRMSLPGGAGVRRTGVDVYEVAYQRQPPAPSRM